MLSRFEETILTGDPEMRNETPRNMRDLQMVYRREQAGQLRQQLEDLGLEPDDLEFYPTTFEKNLCPSTSFESEGGVLYNRRTGVSVAVVLDWVCAWNCGPQQWRGESKPSLKSCQPRYIFTQLGEEQVEQLRTPGQPPRRRQIPLKPTSGWSGDKDWLKTGTDW